MKTKETTEEKINKVRNIIKAAIKLNPPIGGIVNIPKLRFGEEGFKSLFDISQILLGFSKTKEIKHFEVLYGKMTLNGGVLSMDGHSEQSYKNSDRIFKIAIVSKARKKL